MIVKKRHLSPYLSLFLMTVVLSGCYEMKITDFDSNKNKFVLEEYFLGETKAWGIFEDRFGNLRRQFKVNIDGYFDEDLFVLDEDFDYFDGEKGNRVWKIKIIDEGVYEGTAQDILGSATGVAKGNALNWQYVMKLPIAGRELKVKFDDWMFLQSDNVLINRAVVSKWGLNIGTVTIFFEKVNPQAKQVVN